MSGITQILPPHHKHCDEFFSLAEEAAQQGDWAACGASLAAFGKALRAHLAAEEELLFPAFEEATGMRHGPTQMMRLEHGQMRDLLGQMEAACVSLDGDGYAGAAETLLILMQQHNMKEENILYPMCDQSITGQLDALSEKLLERLREAECPTPR